MSVKVAKVTRATAIARELRNDMFVNGTSRGHESTKHENTKKKTFVQRIFRDFSCFRVFLLSCVRERPSCELVGSLLQHQTSERWGHQSHRLIEAVRGDRLRLDAAAVADVAAAVDRGVAVEQFPAEPGLGHAHSV